MTTLTAAQAAKINKMNRAAKDGSLGTAVRTAQTDIATLQAGTGATITAGSYAAVAADASNAKIAITTGLASDTVNFVAQVRRSGSAMPFMKMISGSVAGTIEIYKDPTYTGGSSIAAGDVVTWIAF